MVSTVNPLYASLSAKTTGKPCLFKSSNSSSELFLRVQSPNSVSLRSSSVSPSSVERIKVGDSVLSSSRVRSGSRICASSAPVMDQSPSKTESKLPTIVEVDLGNRSYPIYIGSGLLDQPELLQKFVPFSIMFSNFSFFLFFSLPTIDSDWYFVSIVLQNSCSDEIIETLLFGFVMLKIWLRKIVDEGK